MRSLCIFIFIPLLLTGCSDFEGTHIRELYYSGSKENQQKHVPELFKKLTTSLENGSFSCKKEFERNYVYCHLPDEKTNLSHVSTFVSINKQKGQHLITVKLYVRSYTLHPFDKTDKHFHEMTKMTNKLVQGHEEFKVF